VPELPELTVYRERLQDALEGRRLRRARVHDPFVLRTVEPPLAEIEGRTVTGVGRRAKVLLLELGPGASFTLAFHLMLGGRLVLRDVEGYRPHRRRTLFSAEFEGGPLLEMTEAGTKRKASIRVFGPEGAREITPGTEPLDPPLEAAKLAELLARRNRRLKGALRDSHLLAGIGNAYSDEILFAARLSPLRLTGQLTEEEVKRLAEAIRTVLRDWTERVRRACPEGLPVKQNLWRRNLAIHGRAGKPCPVCGGTVARISFKESETNYCPDCQNEGRLLADRRLSRLGIRRRPPRSSG
jgi:formamidopyrimidine-DNA glycosylase